MEDAATVAIMVVNGVVAMVDDLAAEEKSLVLLTLERSKVVLTSIRLSNFLGQRGWISIIAPTGCVSINSAVTHTGNVIKFIHISTIC